MTPFIFNRLLNEAKYTLFERDGCLYMGEVKITLFHFYGFKYFNRHEFELCSYTDIYNQPGINQIYLPYIKDSVRAINRIREVDKEYCAEQSVSQKKIRNYFCLDLSGQKSKNNGKSSKKKSIYGINSKVENHMKSGNKGD